MRTITLIFILIQSIIGQELAFESKTLDTNVYDLSKRAYVFQKLTSYEIDKSRFQQL